MSKGLALLFITPAVLCAWPLVAAAQTEGGFMMLEEAPEQKPQEIRTSHVEAGVGHVSTDSFKFGEHTGLGESDFFAVGNVEIYQRAPYDSDSTQNWSIVGTNLGLSSRSVHAEYGQQGSFKLFGDFDQIPHLRLDDAETPYRHVGSGNLTLPSGWVPANDAPGFTTLDRNLQNVDIETERKRYGGGFAWNISDDFTLSGSYRREDKDGLETLAGIFGTNGGNPRAVILPKPIDYTTQEGDITLTYNRPMFQGRLNYHLSIFEDNQDNLIWENPFTSSWDASQDYNNGGLGQMALEPDNSAHQISASGAYLVTPTTRLIGSFSYGRMLQDDPFLPYTINSSLNAANGVSSPVPLPRNSLDGDVTTLHGTAGLAANPLPKTDVKVQYTFDKRDNNTPRDIYLTIPNDSDNQSAVDEERARINRPYSRTSHKVELDLGYTVFPGTKVGVGYDFETVNRDFTEVEDTQEHTARFKVRSAPFSFASGWVGYDYSIRHTSDYVSNQPFLDSHTNQVISDLRANDPDGLFENNPYLRKFYIASRRRHLAKGGITVMPIDIVTLGLSGSYSTSDYDSTTIGLTDMNTASVTADASVMPTSDIALSGFFTWDKASYTDVGYQRGNAAINPATVLDPTLFWEQKSNDKGYTAGAEIEWTVIPDKLTFAADYVFSKTVTDFEYSTASGVMSMPVPDLKSTLHSLGVQGEYKVRDDVSLRLGYRVERFDSDDFALDGVGEDIPRVLTLGNESPSYLAHVIWSSVVVHF